MDAVAIVIAKYFYLVVLALAAVYFFLQPGRIKKAMVICGVIIAPLAYLIAKSAGHFYDNARPFVVGHFTPLIAHAADNGFPSDHVLLTAAVAMIVFFFNKKWSAVLFVLAALIGWARVYSGIHHVTDVVGSIAIALLAGGVYRLLAKKFGWEVKG